MLFSYFHLILHSYYSILADPGGPTVKGVGLVDGIAGSYPAGDMDVCLLCIYVMLFCVGRGLCDGLITRPEESYLVSNWMWLRNSNTDEDKAQRGL
jgi:hypothetical protein